MKTLASNLTKMTSRNDIWNTFSLLQSYIFRSLLGSFIYFVQRTGAEAQAYTYNT